MEDKIKQIMLDKLKEMSEKIFEDEACYVDCCSVMNNIAQMLLQCDENESLKEEKEVSVQEKSLKDYSTLELFKELATRNNIHATDNESERQYIGEYPIVRRTLTLVYKYNRLTGEVVE